MHSAQHSCPAVSPSFSQIYLHVYGSARLAFANLAVSMLSTQVQSCASLPRCTVAAFSKLPCSSPLSTSPPPSMYSATPAYATSRLCHIEAVEVAWACEAFAGMALPASARCTLLRRRKQSGTNRNAPPASAAGTVAAPAGTT